MRFFCRPVVPFFALVLFACVCLDAGARGLPAQEPVPPEMRSTQFQVTVNGKPVDVAHAAASYDFVNIDATGPVRIAITAEENGFWDHGVDVQPWRLGIRPLRSGRTIQFEVKQAAKLSISRPGDFLNHAKMLFVFVDRPVAPVPTVKAAKASIFGKKGAGASAGTGLPAGVHVIPAGVHRGSLNPKSGETYYLAPGAVIFGSLNLWKVSNVKVLGRGVIVYDGPQNPEDDDGWMQKPDWHCIGALEAHHVEIHGVTCVVRSRTWSIQMKDSTDFVYDDVRVIGGNPGNANQDGMDWLGGGNTLVKDSFFRASDDVFAMQGNWDGYGHDAMVAPGHDVANITIEHSVLSTSISNIVRAGWPTKTFNSHNFTLRDSDILHGGIGSCGPPFALFTFWGADGAKGDHTGYTFENLWLDDWYSLFQMEQEQPGLDGFTFKNIWALEQPPLVPSKLEGQVKDVRIENVKYGQITATSNTSLTVNVSGGAQAPVYAAGEKQVRAAFHVTPAVLQPGTRADFVADKSNNPRARYTWLFGDGTTAQGRHVRHRFADAQGTELDGADSTGSGRFRVLLHVEDKQGHQDWAEQGLTVVGNWQPAMAALGFGRGGTQPGLEYRIYPGTWPALPPLARETATLNGITLSLTAANAGGFTRYAVQYDGFLQLPTDGGYSFHLLARDGARLTIDGKLVVQTGPPFGEVCGSPVNAVRYALGTIGLRAGRHMIRLETLESTSPGPARLLWEGPGISLTDVPAAAFSHLNVATVQATAGHIAAVKPK
jgi:hypothetical protein